MSKRSSDEDLSKITKKLRKIEKQLKKRESSRRKNRIPSSSSEEAPHSPDKPNTGKPQNPQNPHETDLESILFEIEGQTQLPEPNDPPPSDHDTTMISEAPQEVVSLDDEALQILRDDPTATTEYGANIRQELANRFEHIVTCGLSKEQRSELIQKYLIPGNCLHIGAPKLNPEIKAAIPETVARRDKFIEGRQKKIAATISCLADIISIQLDQKDRDNKLLKNLMDASRLLCDIQNDESNTRRNFAISTLKKETKDSLYNTKIDKYLFGENLTESLKAAKAVSKSGTELKPVAFNKNPIPTQRHSLNWRAPVTTRRLPMTTRSQAPAVPAVRPYQAYRAQPPPPPPPRAPRNTSWRAPPPPPPRSTRKR